MGNQGRPKLKQLMVIPVAVFTYCVAFPYDLSVLLAPVERILGLTKALSPWLYMVLGGAVVAWAIIRVFGERPFTARP